MTDEASWLRQVLDDAKAAKAEWPAWARRNPELFLDLVKKHALAVEGLTEKQLAEAIRQAIACGDFQRQVCASNSSQAVIYIPHAREAFLLNRIRELEGELEILRDYDDPRD